MKKNYLLNIIAASILALPLIILLQRTIPKYTGEILVEAKDSNANLSFDIDGDSTDEKIQFEIINDYDQLYCEVWNTKSLLGVWQRQAHLVKKSAQSCDINNDGKEEIVFYTIENDSIFGNALELSFTNKKLTVQLIHRIYVCPSAGKDFEIFSLRAQMHDLDGDRIPEMIAILNQGATVRGLYAINFKQKSASLCSPHFIHFTNYYVEEFNGEKRIVVTSYANGNIPETRLKDAALKYGADTNKAHTYYTDWQSHILLLDQHLNIIRGPLAFDGMFGMQRAQTLNKNKFLVLQTGLTETDSLETLRLIDDKLNILKEKKLKLPYDKALMSKFHYEIFTAVKINGEQKFIFVANNDSLMEVDPQSLSLKFLTRFNEVKSGSTIRSFDLDRDGQEELLFFTETGIYVTRQDLSDGIFLPSEGKIEFSKKLRYTRSTDKVQGVRTISNRHHYLISYAFNSTWYWKWIFMPTSFIAAFIILITLQKIHSRKLEERNRQLEKTVAERTHEITLQKELIEEKQKEILDSINYAKRIQEAILPSRYSLAENLKNGFVLYKPKDIVAGDFYWLEKHNNALYLAAADCTGHGVPGAMVSVVCSNALSKALLEEGITDTGKILDRTRELVIEKFSKSSDQVKDGMDISLLKIEEGKNQLQWSGANNPLWMIRNNQLTELKPDKQPIGTFAEPKPFHAISLEVQPGDTLFLLTDGYEDQFGGDPSTRSGGKKFKASRMKELLISIQHLTMNEQKEIINQTFENWRGELEQVDDVCVIGIRF